MRITCPHACTSPLDARRPAPCSAASARSRSCIACPPLHIDAALVLDAEHQQPRLVVHYAEQLALRVVRLRAERHLAAFVLAQLYWITKFNVALPLPAVIAPVVGAYLALPVNR